MLDLLSAVGGPTALIHQGTKSSKNPRETRADYFRRHDVRARRLITHCIAIAEDVSRLPRPKLMTGAIDLLMRQCRAGGWRQCISCEVPFDADTVPAAALIAIPIAADARAATASGVCAACWLRSIGRRNRRRRHQDAARDSAERPVFGFAAAGVADMTKRESRLTPSNLIKACRAGARLCRSHGATGDIFSLQPGGRTVKARYALAAIKSGELVPARDALFTDNDSQTWTARKEGT